MNITTSFDKNYIYYAIVMFTSLCETNREHHNIYVMNNSLSGDDFKLIEKCMQKYDVDLFSIAVDFSEYENRLPVSANWTIETYYILSLPFNLESDIERILYLDVDVIVHGTLEKLYNMDFGGMDLLAAPDSNDKYTLDGYSEKQQQMLKDKLVNSKYFNSGVMLMNLKQIRNRYSFDTYIDAMKQWNFEMTAPDQDILNYVHAGNVGYIDYKKYDLFARMAYNDGWDEEKLKKENIIIHYAGDKPWGGANTHYCLEMLWWEYAKMTPVKNEIMELFVVNTMSSSRLEQEAIRLNSENKQYREAICEAGEVMKKIKGLGKI